MRILVAHNSYQQAGGEDTVFLSESEMLAAAGCDVRRFLVNNDHIRGISGKLAAARSVIANRASIEALCAEAAEFHPDVVHFHNFFPTLSPAAISAMLRRNIPVVLTLHNFRLICAGAQLLRNGRPCEDCVGGTKLHAIRHACYRRSRIGSALSSAVGWYVQRLAVAHPRALTLIALTNFGRSRFLADGFPAESVLVRGNAMADPGIGLPKREPRIVFIGRLSEEKGAAVLVRSAQEFAGTIEIIGDGPELGRLQQSAPANVTFKGRLAPRQVLQRLKAATALAVPSLWYEGFPMAVLEAMATGTPVVASRIGALEEIVADGQTGLLVTPNDAGAWRAAMELLLASPREGRRLGYNGRKAFLELHSAGKGAASLIKIYEHAIARIAC